MYISIKGKHISIRSIIKFLCIVFFLDYSRVQKSETTLKFDLVNRQKSSVLFSSSETHMMLLEHSTVISW